MYQIKDYMLIFRKVIGPIILIIFGIYAVFHIQNLTGNTIFTKVFNIASIIIPIALLGLVSYVFFVFRNYLKGIILFNDTKIIEYPSLFKRKQANIYDFDSMSPPKLNNGIYTVHLTGPGLPITFETSSDLISDDIASKMRMLKKDN